MTPFSMQLKRDREGRIVEKTETVAGKTAVWAFAYDKAGRLTRATLNGRTVCDIGYDREGRRARDYFPHLDTSYRTFEYRTDDRLYRAGNNSYIHDENGFRSIWNHGGQYTLYEYGPDYRLLKVEWPEKSELAFTHDDQGRRAAKYRDGLLVEAYAWHDLIRLAGFFDGQREYEFAYRDEERTPCAMRRDDGAVFALHFDQAGSLRVVADEDGNVIKEVQYDPFGSILADTNPALRIPIGFAGGLHDRDLGFVRFGWRDYDTFTSRWTAPDPMGEAGGDPDWYGYCLDDPVNGADPLGLFPPFSQREKDAIKEEMKDKLDGFAAIPSYPLDVFGCFPACHDMMKKKEELERPPRKSAGADREIRKQKPDDISHMGTWWDNMTNGLF